MTMSLPDLDAKLGRILDDRIGLYRLSHKKGHLELDVAAEKQAECEAIRRAFSWFASNAGWIKAEAVRRQAVARQRAELAEIEAEPAVAAVLDEFPGATVTSVTQRQPEAAPS